MAKTTVVVALVSLVAVAAAATSSLPNSWMRGTDAFSLDRDSFVVDGGAFDRLTAAKEAWPGLTHVAVQWMWHQDSATSNTVYAKPKTSPSIANITAFIRKAHSLGLRTILKPLVVGSHGVQMPWLSPSDPAAWFASYGALMAEVYDLAYAENVDVVSVGLELFQLVKNQSNTPLWRALIANGRARCPSCRLTYCSNPIMDEQADVAFWTDLDFVGLDLYVPFVISREPNATVVLPDIPAMKGVFDYVMEKHVYRWYRNFSAVVANAGGNPPKLVITESGYPSSNLGMQSPWLPAEQCTPTPSGNASIPFANFTAQQVAYEVMFDRLTQSAVVDYFEGFVNFWLPLPGNSDYYPQRNESDSMWACSWATLQKPAAATIAAAFRRN